MPFISLENRALLLVAGADAQDFLQALITTDVVQLGVGEVRPGALLTPQGKILFDFMISRTPEGFRLETDRAQADALLKRLTLYKLRAAVALTLEKDNDVAVAMNEQAGGFRDSRFQKAGQAVYRLYGADHAATDDRTLYDAARIAAGIAEAGTDYALQDAFPHDVLLDKTEGLSFRKGCYVGQEVVSRMQHRGTARRRVVTVTADALLPETGTVLTVAGRPIGTLGSVAGQQGLAIVRIDKAGDAMARGEAILAGDVAVSLALPDWTGLSFPTESDEASA